MRVYICGPMSGLPDFNYPAFAAAAADLRGKGYEVLSPHEWRDHPRRAARGNLPYATYLRRGLRLMLKCEEVFVLPGWEKSDGATFEVSIARKLAMPVHRIDEAWISNRRAEKLAGQQIEEALNGI